MRVSEGAEIQAAPFHSERHTRRAAVDEAQVALSGPATKREYRRLAGIPSGNTGKALALNEDASHARQNWRKTTSGAREGRPGYLRMDTVHQGDQDGIKGVYHIDAVDEITQWQAIACRPQISEAFLLLPLEPVLQQISV